MADRSSMVEARRNLFGSVRPAARHAGKARQAPHYHAHQIVRKCFAEYRLLALLRQQRTFAVAVVAHQSMFFGGNDLMSARAHGEFQRVGQFIFSRYVQGRHREDALGRVIADDMDDSRRLVLAVIVDAGARGQQRLAQAEVEIRLRIGGVDAHHRERTRQWYAALQPEGAATYQAGYHQAGHRQRGGAAAHITRFTSLSGTWTALRTSLPARKRCTCGSASAASTASCRCAPAGSCTRPRNLPLTCTISSTKACASASRSGSGHGSSITAVMCPSECHSV